jgi:hypothetical protein
MAEDDWLIEFTRAQDDSPLKPYERQEVRAKLVLERVARARRRKYVYWGRTLLLMATLATAAAQATFLLDALKWLARAVRGGGA